MTNRLDAIGILEAAYAWDADETRWLDGVVSTMAPFDLGGGCLSYILRLESQPRLSAAVTRGTPFDLAKFGVTFNRMPKAYMVAVHAPSYRVEPVNETGFRTCALLGLPVEALRASMGYEPPPSWGIRPGDAGSFCWATLFYCAPDARPSREASRQLALVAPHLAAAARLRSAMTSAASAEDEATEAVLGADGAVHDARGDARPARTRARLADLARTIDRARTRRGRASTTEALAAWTALLDGRWSLVESEERDGRRFLLARKNAPGLRDPIALDPMERAVVALAVQGQPHKLMAYSLGLSRDTVHVHLRAAMRKLRVSSRAELIRVYAPLFAGVAQVAQAPPVGATKPR